MTRKTVAVARIEGIRFENYRALKDVTLGKLWNTPRAWHLAPVTAVVGRNGADKSSVLDAFGFLADCLKLGVEGACDMRGGFDRIRSQGSSGPIGFEIYFRRAIGTRPVTYELDIDTDDKGRPCVARECLLRRHKGQRFGRPFPFLLMNNGSGVAWKGDALGQQADGPFSGFRSSSREEERAETEQVELHDKGRFGIDALGGLSRHPRIAAFREFIEGFDLSQFAPDAARSMPLAGPRKHLNVCGDNPGDVTQFMEREHRDRLAGILRKINEGRPYADRIGTKRYADGRLLLRFKDWRLRDPSQTQELSDGMLKALAYLFVLETPSPPTLIGIKEPGKGLHRQLLEILVQDLRGRAFDTRKPTQIFVTTHQPDLADALRPDEVWILEKGEDGFSTISRASHDETVWELVGEPELRLGELWRSGYLG